MTAFRRCALVAFQTVARYGSFTRAADLLGLPQAGSAGRSRNVAAIRCLIPRFDGVIVIVAELSLRRIPIANPFG
ncbi:helix-turn-helix domain-containing protein [Rhodobacter viridis]|uniref:helix-turn-helix domain-containing protein n=1 Tax=Rhodobacter viridis TaxID=1054202 RepID=UPI0037443866